MSLLVSSNVFPLLKLFNGKIVLVSLRSAPEHPASPIEALKDYYGAYNDHKWNDVDELREKILALKEENGDLAGQLENLAEEIEFAKEEQLRLAEEEELRKKEEEETKGKTKGKPGRR
jgi:chromosome segregation ATPase